MAAFKATLMLLGRAVLSADVSPRLTIADVALVQDDECSAEDPEGCAFNALQLRGVTVAEPLAGESSDGKEIGDDVAIIDELPPDFPHQLGSEEESEDEAGKESEADLAPASYHGGGCPAHPTTKNCYLYAMCPSTMRYCLFGGHIIVPGRYVRGMENINGANAASFEYLMTKAHQLCSDSHCVLLVNPVGYRTQEQLHIHFRRYNKGGANMKRALEAAVCGRGSGWHNFAPAGCGGDSKARVFGHWPAVFEVVAEAYGGGSLANVGITVWESSSCGGGSRTIVQTVTHCSIEHTVSDR